MPFGILIVLLSFVQPNSPYNLRKPHDVLAFVQQDEFSRRLKQLNQVLKDNSHKLEKADIEKDDDKLVSIRR